MPPNQRRFYAVSPSQKSPSSTSSGTASSFAQQLVEVEVHPERDGDYGGTEPTMRSPSGDGGDSGRSRPAHFPSRAGRVPVEMMVGVGSVVHRWRKGCAPTRPL